MTNDASTIESAVAKIIEEMVTELELDFDDPIGPETRLIADLGFASVDFIHLIVELEGHFQQKMGFHDLIMPNGQYVDDLPVGDLVAFVGRRLAGDEPTPEPAEVAALSESVPEPANVSTLRPEDVEHFRSLMPSLEKWGSFPRPDTQNPRAVFVFSAPRSGSTLFRVILAGNPGLFAPPEMHLLNYATMGQRNAALDNKWNEHLLSGTIRAVMPLKNCSAEEATEFLKSCEQQDMPTHDFYGHLEGLLGSRLLVDKTPIYAMHEDILRRAERDFDGPLFIHLVRHPGGMIRSFEDAKIEQLIPFMRESHFTRRQLAELTWYVTNQNIARLLADVPSSRWLRVRFEDLVRDPRGSVTQLCEFLSVPFAEEMLDPYKDPESRMTGGLSTAAQYSGDLKFHLHARIEPDAADRWKKFDSENSLSPMTRALAAEFGY
jgi:acyl carrier protein